MRPLSNDWDLAIGLALMVVVSAAIYWISRNATRRCSTRMCGAAVVVAFLSTFAFVTHLLGQLEMARLLPLPNVIVLGNWLPPCAAMLAGIVAGHGSIPKWRQTAVVGILIGLGSYTAICDSFAGSPQPGPAQFLRGECMQTTPNSCSACCAATLLMQHGIPSGEREMMGLCLTRHGGTPELGLYRGLKLKTQNGPWDVEILPSTPETLREPTSYPAILLIEVKAVPSGESHAWLRPRQADHAVIAYGITKGGRIDICDPSSGRASWSFDDLRQRWFGDGLRLVRRS